MQKSTVQKDGIALEKYKNIAQNEPQNTSKWLPEEQLNGYNFIT